jgi:hypothetical protein
MSVSVILSVLLLSTRGPAEPLASNKVSEDPGHFAKVSAVRHALNALL